MSIKFNQRNLKIAIAAGMLVGSAGLTVPAFAEPVAPPPHQTTMDVSAQIGNACTVETTNIVFGTYDAIITNATEKLKSSTGKIKSTCTIGLPAKINIDKGKYGTDAASRKMKTTAAPGTGEVEYLNYNVHIADNSTPWPISNGKPITGTGSLDSHDVFAAVAAGQKTATIGSYEDQLLVTVTY